MALGRFLAAGVGPSASVVFKDGALPFVVAGVVGGGLGLIEQANRLRSRFTLANSAWWWWSARVAVEIGVAVAGLAILRGTEPSVANHVWAWIAAGAGGVALARLRFLDLEQRPVGLATVYEPTRAFIEDHLDRRSAECMATWLNKDMLPRLGRVGADPGDLVQYVTDFVNSLYLLAPAEAAREIGWLHDARDSNHEPLVKLELIARHIALELKGYRLLSRYVKEQEAKTR